MQRASQYQAVEFSRPEFRKQSGILPVTIIVAARNEASNLPRCLQSVSAFSQVYVVDSQSTDGTPEIACDYGAQVVDFHYRGGWPKKRQWALDTLAFDNDWILLLDADEAVPPELQSEIEAAIKSSSIAGFYISLQMIFLGRHLRHCGAAFRKLCLFRRGAAHFECRLKDQDISMCDMEVHEHIIVDGPTATLKNHIDHHNVASLHRFIEKHNEYSNWESRVLTREASSDKELPPSLWGSQAQRRRWLKRKLFRLPGSPVALFLYRYIFRLGFCDGVPGLIYCSFQAIQMFHTKAKIYELKNLSTTSKD